MIKNKKQMIKDLRNINYVSRLSDLDDKEFKWLLDGCYDYCINPIKNYQYATGMYSWSYIASALVKGKAIYLPTSTFEADGFNYDNISSSINSRITNFANNKFDKIKQSILSFLKDKKITYYNLSFQDYEGMYVFYSEKSRQEVLKLWKEFLCRKQKVLNKIKAAEKIEKQKLKQKCNVFYVYDKKDADKAVKQLTKKFNINN